MSKLIIFKVILIIVTNSAISSQLDPINHVANPPNESLQTDLKEFLNLIPVDEIRNLTTFFYANDKKMRDSYDYLRHKGFKLVTERLSKLTLIKKFMTFLNESRVDFAELGQRIETIVLTSDELESIEDVNKNEDMGGMNGFFNEALSLIPQEEVLSLFFVKMEESNAFSSFLEKISSSDFENLTDNMKKSQGLQSIYFDFHSHGIDILECANSLKKFLGY